MPLLKDAHQRLAVFIINRVVVLQNILDTRVSQQGAANLEREPETAHTQNKHVTTGERGGAAHTAPHAHGHHVSGEQLICEAAGNSGRESIN